jgi:hypothetical protein
MNIVDVLIQTEDGCNYLDGEYTVSIIGFVGSLDLTAVGGTDDATLIKECIDNAVMSNDIELCQEGFEEVRVIESGEWEDVFWHKYYVIMPEVSNNRTLDI